MVAGPRPGPNDPCRHGRGLLPYATSAAPTRWCRRGPTPESLSPLAGGVVVRVVVEEVTVPNTSSAAKRHKQSEKRRLRNQAVKSEIKTFVLKTRAAIAAGDLEQARELARQTESRLDKAAKRGIVHRNNANRRAARLHRAISRAAAPASVEA